MNPPHPLGAGEIGDGARDAQYMYIGKHWRDGTIVDE